MAHFNRAVTNKVSIHVAGWAPGLGIVVHVGRRTRTVYRTPVNVFPTKDGFRFALTYGHDAEWVRNALAHGAVRLITAGSEYELTDPEVVHDPHRQHVGRVGRGIMRFIPRVPFRISDRPVRAAHPLGIFLDALCNVAEFRDLLRTAGASWQSSGCCVSP